MRGKGHLGSTHICKSKVVWDVSTDDQLSLSIVNGSYVHVHVCASPEVPSEKL